MTQPIFLTLPEVNEIHVYQLEHFGGSSGVRDINLLKSAVAMPEMSFGGVMLHKDIYEMAAAYLFHIAENHPFIDGNKRTGAMTSVVFLDINGIDFNSSDEDFTQMVLAVASGNMQKGEIAAFFRSHCSERQI
ncbi:MAG: type II toxin-antitoxin system death-on-curing family toxin [Victivallales bacterium]|nr:type II toxin-antitoxin system death-on-curing family toxin [Victivallales bacterium]